MNKTTIQNTSNLFTLWQHNKKFALITFLLFHIVFLGFCLREYLTNSHERYYPTSSNIGRFVYYPDFSLNWLIILFLAVFFLLCPTQIFNKISFCFYSIAFIYFMGFFLFFIGSFFGISFFIFYSLLSIPSQKETS